MSDPVAEARAKLEEWLRSEYDEVVWRVVQRYLDAPFEESVPQPKVQMDPRYDRGRRTNEDWRDSSWPFPKDPCVELLPCEMCNDEGFVDADICPVCGVTDDLEEDEDGNPPNACLPQGQGSVPLLRDVDVQERLHVGPPAA